VLTPLDDTPWHQLPTTFDHVGPSDPRFFDRLWFAGSDGAGASCLQFTLGVYQNMNVVDGGFVVVHGGRQHNLRVSRELRPRYETAAGPLSIEVVSPLEHIHLSVGANRSGTTAELDWRAVMPAQEEAHHFARLRGRVLEDYARYDQIGELTGWVEVGGTRVEVDRWWSCRDHSWGVRERVGVPEPRTGEQPPPAGSLFAFLFFSTTTHGGHLQVTRRAGADHLTAELTERSGGATTRAGRLSMEAEFSDDGRPRRFSTARFSAELDDGREVVFDVTAQGPAVAMTGLGYGGYDDGLGLGVHRGTDHLESEVWDVGHPAVVTYPDGRSDRPVHRIQPVRVVQRGPDGVSEGTGSLTFIAETDIDADGRLRVTGRRGH
jgi:hypothetical protein